ncbi:hypothetical protein Taro_012878 [Colocasia esculenta]|uniref:Uncharacterized protein n=1 Tax=Colocasia esculenta TaxID=4460 RepID=A0A843UAG2_COLES|nr:hypothetical protein [Colocasia esculenta]
MYVKAMDQGIAFRTRQPDPSCSSSERAVSRRRILKATEAPVTFKLTRTKVERQLDLSSVAASLRGRLVWFVRSFPTEPVTCEAHPYLFQVRESRRLPVLHLVQSRTAAELGLHHQQCNLFFLFTSGLLYSVLDSS